MGYESRIYIVDVYRFEEQKERIFDVEECVYKTITRNDIFPEIIAMINCEQTYTTLPFDKEIDYKLWIDKEETDKDKYGDKLKYASVSEIIAYLDNSENELKNPRVKALYSMLKGFNENEWHDLQVVHYGY